MSKQGVAEDLGGELTMEFECAGDRLSATLKLISTRPMSMQDLVDALDYYAREYDRAIAAKRRDPREH